MRIIWGTDVNGGKIVFYDGDDMDDIGKRAHVMKHSRGRCAIGVFDKNLHKGSIWTGYRSALMFILHKLIFHNFMHNGTIFYDKYISSGGNIYDEGSGVFPKKS